MFLCEMGGRNANECGILSLKPCIIDLSMASCLRTVVAPVGPATTSAHNSRGSSALFAGPLQGSCMHWLLVLPSASHECRVTAAGMIDDMGAWGLLLQNVYDRHECLHTWSDVVLPAAAAGAGACVTIDAVPDVCHGG